jgi:hypothetical protein
MIVRGECVHEVSNPQAGRESTHLFRVSSMYQTMLETVGTVGPRATRLDTIANVQVAHPTLVPHVRPPLASAIYFLFLQ